MPRPRSPDDPAVDAAAIIHHAHDMPGASHATSARSALAAAGWFVLTFLAPAAGAFRPPGDWYATLVKPTWNPPSWVFGPVWTFLYLSMALAAWLVWRRGGWQAQRRALTLYLVQLALNAAWTPLFFGLKQPGLALVVIVLLLAAILATARAFQSISRPAALLLLPYAAWVGFATVLNFTLWSLNR